MWVRVTHYEVFLCYEIPPKIQAWLITCLLGFQPNTV